MRVEYIIPVVGLLTVFGAIAFMWWEFQQNIKEWKASQDEIDEWFEQRKVYWENNKRNT
jgi:hypothetical protein